MMDIITIAQASWEDKFLGPPIFLLTTVGLLYLLWSISRRGRIRWVRLSIVLLIYCVISVTLTFFNPLERSQGGNRVEFVLLNLGFGLYVGIVLFGLCLLPIHARRESMKQGGGFTDSLESFFLKPGSIGSDDDI